MHLTALGIFICNECTFWV